MGLCITLPAPQILLPAETLGHNKVESFPQVAATWDHISNSPQRLEALQSLHLAAFRSDSHCHCFLTSFPSKAMQHTKNINSMACEKTFLFCCMHTCLPGKSIEGIASFQFLFFAGYQRHPVLIHPYEHPSWSCFVEFYKQISNIIIFWASAAWRK